MERATDREFCEIFECTLVTSGPDIHGDILPEEEILDFQDQLENNPEKRILRHNHREESKVGEIIEVWDERKVKDDDEILYLNAEVGIFQEREEIADQIREGILGGMSVGAHFYPTISDEEWGDRNPDLEVEIPPSQRSELQPFLASASDLEFRLKIEKSAFGSTLFQILGDNSDAIVELVKLLAMFYIGQRVDREQVPVPDVSIVEGNIDINLNLALGNTIETVIEETSDEEPVKEEDIEEVAEEEIEQLKT